VKTLIFSILLVVLTAILGLGVCACGGDSENGGSTDIGPGARPVLEKGDQWKFKAYDNESEYHITLTVVGVGKYYNLKMEIEPPLEGMIAETIADFDKNLLLPVSMSMAGEGMGMDFSVESTAEYEIISGQRWPLEVGRELKIEESTTTTMDFGGDTSTETETQTNIYKVEALEEIATEAGIFECFRVAKFDESGDKVSTSWYSDEVKTQIKEIDHEIGETQELISYSVK